MGKKVGGVLQTQYVWSGDLRVVGELDASGALTSRFVYGNKLNVPELIVRLDPTDGPKTYRVITDQLGSPVYVVNIADPADVLLDAEYDEWGNVLSYNSSTGSWPIPFGFTGGLYDSDTKLVRFVARDYDPTTGRWTAKDPILFGGGQSNLYVYAGNDPLNRVDPTGLVVFDVLGKIWAWPTTAVGLTVGTVGGVAGGNFSASVGNNAVEFRGQAWLSNFTGAVTLGNVIIYASQSPGLGTQDHETQHTKQAQWLGPYYLPLHALSQVAGFGYSFFDPSRTYTNLNDRVHSPANLLECGPSDGANRRPWPWH